MSNPRFPCRLVAILFATTVVLSHSGCGGTGSAAVEPAARSERARAILILALDAWKNGQPHDVLPRSSPPVRVADEEWLAGAKLVDYTLDDEAALRIVGDTVYWPVTLTLTDTRGRPARRRVVYLVITAPDASVIRQD